VSWFWIIGIVANVTLTVAAIVWVIRQGKPRDGSAKDDAAKDGAADEPNDPRPPS
jgi:hypothetical protein